MTEELAGRRIAFLVAPEGAEQVELTEPWEAVRQAGGEPQLVSTRSGSVRAFRHLDPADTFPVDRVVADTGPADYDGLVLPGGVANPDFLRTDPDAVICHGSWTLIEADVVRGRRITSWPGLRTDLRNAGATWADEEVVVDRGLISSRKPDDLPAFRAALVREFAAHTQRV